ncbi:Cingulin [Channa argus]|uniref:Cingulin n=1 Tax=Channa argus TaxID=215402 RepID=A0A6G1QX99_CHAAH|nr:Cingulin [Channa argus]
MSTISTDRKALVDYGVQIRFIKDLDDSGGGYPDKSRGSNSATPTSNKYGVAVRVQGISGQPYVVLKDGEKGDSYGVQLNSPTSSSGSPSPYNSLPKISKEPAEFTNPYCPVVNTARSPVPQAEDEDGEIFGSPLKRPPGDGEAGTQGEEELGARRDGQVARAKAESQLKAPASGTEKKKAWTSSEKYNEAGLKPVKLNGVAPRRVEQTLPGFTGSLGRHSGKKQCTNLLLESFPETPASVEADPATAIDTNSLAPINKLISQFNYGTPGSTQQARGRSGARQRLRFDERRRSRSLDARKDVQPEVSLPSPSSPTVNPYAVPRSTSSTLLTSSASASGSLGRSPASVAKVMALEAPKPSFKSPGKFASKDTPPIIAKKPETLLKSQNTELVSGVEAPVKQAFYNSRLAEERMAREGAESRLRLQEDQLAELQEELRRVSENYPHSDSLHTDLAMLQAELAEAAMLRQRQEDTLRQRERELTALKGALKEEVECHDREMEVLREQYSQDMDNLNRTMEQSQEQIEEEREKVNASMLTLEKELDSSRGQGQQWKKQLEATTQELHSTREDNPELQRCHDDLKQARADVDKQKGNLHKKSEALEALEKASREKEAALLSEISKLKEQSQLEKAELEKSLEKAKKVKHHLGTVE